MRILLMLSAIICLAACKKNEVLPTSAPEILMTREWYPYHTRIVSVDSIITATTDANGNTQTKSSVSTSDTSFVLSSCKQQSIHKFKENGIMVIKDMCSTGQPEINASWLITQTNALSLLFYPNTTPAYPGYSQTYGQVTKISTKEFTFTTANSIYWFTNTGGPNGTTLQESHKVSLGETMNYKSR